MQANNKRKSRRKALKEEDLVSRHDKTITTTAQTPRIVTTNNGVNKKKGM